MSEEKKTFEYSIDGISADTVASRLEKTTFTQSGNRFSDPNGREIEVLDGRIVISIPKTGVVDEQEQLEFLAGLLDIDVDEV